MPLVMPPAAKSNSRTCVVFLTTPPAAATGIPTITEANAGVFASLHINGNFPIAPTQNTGEGPVKLGAEFSETRFGRKNFPPIEVSYSYMPQDAATPGANGNEVFDVLKEGATLTALVLRDMPGDTDALTAGDVAHVLLVECGVQSDSTTGDGEFDEFAITQQLRVVGGEPIALHHALAAA